MTNITGHLHKMQVQNNKPVEYSFNLHGTDGSKLPAVSVNSYLGKSLTIEFTGKINCIACNRAIKKTYNQGYCFPCAQKIAAADLCILKPEICHFDKGTCREPEWGKSQCFTSHIVYLANSSGLKVGLTRETQLPTRWIDQGATQALPILRVKSRHQAGLIEVAIANIIADKTDWRKMLLNNNVAVDLKTQRDNIFGEIALEFQKIAGQFKFGDIEILTSESITEIEYPILTSPKKISSLNADKTPLISGVLNGIKGQYLIFDTGVINIRKYTGYEVKIT